MTRFEAIFGIKSSEVKKNCVLAPLLYRGVLDSLKIKSLKKGRLYSSGSNDDFSLIVTGMGACFVGDAVLYLQETGCQNAFLFGSCGLVKEKNGLGIGSLVSPSQCYAYESFSGMLLEKNLSPKAFSAGANLYDRFLEANEDAGIKKVTCSTLSSLKLEEEMADLFIAKGVDVVDMECSAFFSASVYAGFNAAALFYISDIIHKKPFYAGLDKNSQLLLFRAVKNASGLLCKFIKENLSA